MQIRISIKILVLTKIENEQEIDDKKHIAITTIQNVHNENMKIQL